MAGRTSDPQNPVSLIPQPFFSGTDVGAGLEENWLIQVYL